MMVRVIVNFYRRHQLVTSASWFLLNDYFMFCKKPFGTELLLILFMNANSIHTTKHSLLFQSTFELSKWELHQLLCGMVERNFVRSEHFVNSIKLKFIIYLWVLGLQNQFRIHGASFKINAYFHIEDSLKVGFNGFENMLKRVKPCRKIWLLNLGLYISLFNLSCETRDDTKNNE